MKLLNSNKCTIFLATYGIQIILLAVTSCSSLQPKAETAETARYRSVIRERLTKLHFRIGKPKKPLQAFLFVKLTATGEIKECRVFKSSGEKKFDLAVMEMVSKASPLPAPPPSMVDSPILLKVVN